MPSALARSLVLLRAPGNALGFIARRRVRWSRGTATLADEDKVGLFDSPYVVRERELRERYDLTALHATSTRLHYAENVALLDGLERLLGAATLPLGPDGTLRGLDVGSGAFVYATALQRFLARGGTGPERVVHLRGLEVDGHGVYRDGHSRADHARAHVRLAGPLVTYEVGDVLAADAEEHDVVTCFYPFLTRHALLAWGLPLRLFRPRELLAQLARSVRPGGLLVIANQTREEYATLCTELAAHPVERFADASFASDFVPYAERTRDRVGSAWRRTHSSSNA